MTQAYIGYLVIIVLYAVIGVLAAAGSVFVFRKVLPPKWEQVFYGLFLVAIAAFYLAFVAYFGAASALRFESVAVLVFAVIGLFGTRLPVALMVGYPLHGLWDLLHELQAQGTLPALGPDRLTAIPLAYGVFCAAFDFFMAGYFDRRRLEWDAAWRPAHDIDRPSESEA
jgi:uncharacterized protein DUF6010